MTAGSSPPDLVAIPRKGGWLSGPDELNAQTREVRFRGGTDAAHPWRIPSNNSTDAL
jgi:hypothetical protein